MSEKRLDLEIPSVDDLFKVSDDDKNKIVLKISLTILLKLKEMKN